MNFKKTIKNRRSYYSISKNTPLRDEEITHLVEFAMKNAPSAFNCQSQMMAVMLGDKHEQLWDIVMETLRKVVSPEQFPATEEKINSFKAGYGTVLYFNDDDITKNLQAQFPTYADNFPVWAEQSSGMLQFAVWNMLEAEGLGASLQHYSPLIDEAVKTTFEIPSNWRLIAQMPFGKPTAKPQTKEFTDIKTRIKVYESEAKQEEEEA